eukprot:TRINITY_DN3602_c0_g3_i1.p2 TRINITY_DN3602_c0_g3~~TRINITY_DN3602_c0_g3_i1.p2  ORF type:complete len:267 (-),score=18.48 TRINITY_DN3602_c0_g3_i1:939-1739(-)
MTGTRKYQSLLEDEDDFFKPVKCCQQLPPGVSVVKLKESWEKQRKAEKEAEKTGKQLIQRELGLSKSQLKTFLHRVSGSGLELNKPKAEGQLDEQNDVREEKVENEVNQESSVTPIIQPQAIKLYQDDDDMLGVKQDLMQGKLHYRCRQRCKCTKRIFLILVRFAINIVYGMDTAEHALDLLLQLLNNLNELEYLPDSQQMLDIFQECIGKYDEQVYQRQKKLTFVASQKYRFLSATKSTQIFQGKCHKKMLTFLLHNKQRTGQLC